MKAKLLFLFAAFCFFAKAQILTKVDSMQVTQATIWGVTGDKGDSLTLTTTLSVSGQPQIFLRKVSYSNIHNQSTPKQITTGADFANGRDLTDHKHIVLNSSIFVSFSTQGDQEVFLFKTDLNGNRVGSLVTVFQGSGFPCNDMILTTDSTYIYVGIFAPPNQHKMYKFDTNLNPVGSPTTTTVQAHNNLAGAVHQNGQFYMFSGSTFGFNSNLILSQWTNNWAPIGNSTQTLVASSGGDGNFFGTGVAYYPASSYWIAGYNHINNGQSIGQEHLDIAVFDATNSNSVLELKHRAPSGSFRYHFVVKGNYLYAAYDRISSVYLVQYQITPSSSIPQRSEELFGIYPNPSAGKFHIDNGSSVESIEVSDALGRVILSTTDSEICLDQFVNGIYNCRLKIDGRYYNRKLIKDQ